MSTVRKSPAATSAGSHREAAAASMVKRNRNRKPPGGAQAKSVKDLQASHSVADPDRAQSSVVQQVISIPIEKLHRHPSNRTITPESVQELVQSLEDHGQREPIRVREHPERIGHYEIISGERRYVAAQQVSGIDSLQAIVEVMTDSTSLVELAVANAARKDLDPIERAQLLQDLITPIDEGGAGMDRDAAGRIFGLNSESGVKNTLRLLKLPRFFRDQLTSGQMSIAAVRPLCAYPEVFVEGFAKWLQDKRWELENYQRGNDEERSDVLDSFEQNVTRPLGDSKHTHYHGYQLGGHLPCLFNHTELSEQQQKTLDIHEIPDGDGGVRLVAMNVKAWHKLQDPLVAKRATSKSKPIAELTKKSTSGKEAAPTPAELKARRKKQDDQLTAYTQEWICKVLRSTMANRSAPHVIMAMVPWLLQAVLRAGNCYADLYTWATAELVGGQTRRNQFDRPKHSAHEAYQLHQIRSAEWWTALWRVTLWPVATRNDTDVGLATIGTIPDRMPMINRSDVHELAIAVGVSMDTVWQHAAEEGWERSMVLRWLEYHTKDQLIDLAKSLKVTLTTDKRGLMAAELLEHHRIGHGRQLHLPAALAKVAKRGAR